jgi:hypothetical protein
MTVVRRSAGKASTRIDSVSAAIIAPPRPWTARHAISCSSAVDRAHPMDAAVNTINPATNRCLRPYRSPRDPPTRIRPASVSVYALITHSRPWGVESSSRSMDGRATFTIVMSSRIIACAIQQAASVSPSRRRGGSATIRGSPSVRSAPVLADIRRSSRHGSPGATPSSAGGRAATPQGTRTSLPRRCPAELMR